jgi:hypothetical protein
MTTTVKKEYTIHFYSGENGGKGDGLKTMGGALSLIGAGNEWLQKGNRAGLRVDKVSDKYIYGEVKVYRDDAPHVGKVAEADEELVLAENLHVIEKSYFLYSLETETLLLVQTNFTRGPALLDSIIRENTPGSENSFYFSSILNEDGYERLEKQIASIRLLECAIWMPTARMAPAPTLWGKKQMAAAEGSSGRYSFSIGGNLRGSVKYPVEPSAVRNVIEGAKSGLLVKAKAYSIDGTGESIDLLQDRLKATFTIKLNGRYPTWGKMRNALKNAFKQHESEL